MGLMTQLFGGGSRQISPAEMRRDPIGWLMETGDGKGTTAGIHVDESNAMTVPAVFACGRVISEDVAKLPLILYRRLEPKGKERARDDSRFRLMRVAPNPDMGAFDFEQAIILCAVLWGNGFAEITRDPFGIPVRLDPIFPTHVTFKRDDMGRLFYEIRDPITDEKRTVRPQNMLHVKGLSATGLVGFLAADLGAEAIGLALAAQRFTASFFATGTAAQLGIEMPGKKPENLEEWRRQFEEKHTGARKAHRPLVISEGATFKTLSVDPEKSQMIETLRFSVEQLARYFRVPPHKIQDLARSTFNNIEHQSLEYIGDTILTWTIRVEEESNRKLLTEEEQEELFFEHLIDALMRADMNTRSEFYAAALQNGWMSRNEVRERENMNEVPGGDLYYINQAVAVIGEDGKPVPANTPPAEQNPTPNGQPPQPDDDEEEEDDERAEMMRPVLVDAAMRKLASEQESINRQKKRDAAGLIEWAAKWYDADAVRSAFSPAVFALAKDKAPRVLDAYATSHIEASMRLLRNGYPVTYDDRAEKIADEILREVAG